MSQEFKINWTYSAIQNLEGILPWDLISLYYFLNNYYGVRLANYLACFMPQIENID